MEGCRALEKRNLAKKKNQNKPLGMLLLPGLGRSEELDVFWSPCHPWQLWWHPKPFPKPGLGGLISPTCGTGFVLSFRMKCLMESDLQVTTRWVYKRVRFVLWCSWCHTRLVKTCEICKSPAVTPPPPCSSLTHVLRCQSTWFWDGPRDGNSTLGSSF